MDDSTPFTEYSTMIDDISTGGSISDREIKDIIESDSVTGNITDSITNTFTFLPIGFPTFENNEYSGFTQYYYLIHSTITEFPAAGANKILYVSITTGDDVTSTQTIVGDVNKSNVALGIQNSGLVLIDKDSSGSNTNGSGSCPVSANSNYEIAVANYNGTVIVGYSSDGEQLSGTLTLSVNDPLKIYLGKGSTSYAWAAFKGSISMDDTRII